MVVNLVLFINVSINRHYQVVLQKNKINKLPYLITITMSKFNHLNLKKLRILLLIIVFIILNILFIPLCYILSFFSSKIKSKHIWQYFARIMYKWSFIAGNIKINVDGMEHVPTETAIFAGDHRSLSDSFAILIVLKRYFFSLTAPLEYFPWFLKIWIKKLDFISIFRDKSDEKKYDEAVTKTEAIYETIKRLKKKESLLVYPEGHHERHKGIKPFHTGAVRFAIETKVPIIPIGIIGTDNIITPDKNIFHPGTIHLKFGRPIYYNKYYGKLNDHKLIHKLTKELKEQVNYLIHHKI
jgi:1-acyl-sn-glycerol-3-phosphate acyltransferase